MTNEEKEENYKAAFDRMESAKEKKALVLQHSLKMEAYTRIWLSAWLGLDQHSASLGLSHDAITFNQRMNLLRDTDLIKQDEKWMFETFIVIRNKFLHVYQINTFKQIWDKYLDHTKGNFFTKVIASPLELGEYVQHKKTRPKLLSDVNEERLYKGYQVLFAMMEGLMKERVFDIADLHETLQGAHKMEMFYRFVGLAKQYHFSKQDGYRTAEETLSKIFARYFEVFAETNDALSIKTVIERFKGFDSMDNMLKLIFDEELTEKTSAKPG